MPRPTPPIKTRPSRWTDVLTVHVDTGEGSGWVHLGDIDIERSCAFDRIVFIPVINAGLATELAECADLIPIEHRRGIA